MIRGDLRAQLPRAELWAGAECTMARVGDDYRDQLEETGHLSRRSDIDLISSLGVTTVRFPILWEKIAPQSNDRCDFGWTDDRLAMLRERNIDVIAGLVHHGSGPRHTSLVDPVFAAKLGDFAARVADRYPWIERWTPVNEPLTTARFSGLYGHWYPHGRDDATMLRALVNECAGTAAAMAAIRKSNPAAKLVQTEDLGKTFATPPLRYQADYENERRWLSLDLLTGKIDEAHPWRRRMLKGGIEATELDAFLDGSAAPDILGINHYLTSERFLDHRLHLYDGAPSGNGHDRYHDGEAVRIEALHRETGIGPRLREAWERFRIPIAVTEVHHGCTRDEQLRWFVDVLNAVEAQRRIGVDVRAVTLWSLFGSVDWRSLLTRRDGVYDTGAFDIRSPTPRPTIVASAARAFAHGEEFDHPVLDVPGWWCRPQRLYDWHGPCDKPGDGGRKLLITGATGTLGQAFARICEHRGLPFCLTDRAELDISDDASIAAAIARHRPWAIINTAGFVRVADAEREQDACLRENAEGAAALARSCAAVGIPLVTFSTDLVFDGTLGRPYVESDAVDPQNIYGLSKARAEEAVLRLCDRSLVIRTSAFFGPWDEHNFVWHCLRALAAGDSFSASSTASVSPTYVPDLCHAALDLLIDGESGIWHVANQGGLSWFDIARRAAAAAGFDTDRVLPIDEGEPRSTEMASIRGALLRPAVDAIDECVSQVLHRLEFERVDFVAAE